MNEQRQNYQFSRRAFLGFFTLSLAAFILWIFRRVDIADRIQTYFGLKQDSRRVIEFELSRLRQKDPVFFSRTVWFFSLEAVQSGRLLGRKLKQQVLNGWIEYLFSKRSISWPYVGYPFVGDYQICNGLIRRNHHGPNQS